MGLVHLSNVIRGNTESVCGRRGSRGWKAGARAAAEEEPVALQGVV